MKWTDTGIVLSTIRHGESSAVVKLFTASRGIHAGLSRIGRSNRGTFQTGNIVEATWQGRLEEHLGSYRLELKSPVAGLIMNDRAKLAGLQSACTMVEQTMAERDSHPSLYYAMEDFLLNLRVTDKWISHYVLFEIELLRNLGFGLDLEKCINCGTKDSLQYVSPKSGGAVCEPCGEPYKGKLLGLPGGMDILKGLELTHHFFEQSFFAPHDKKIPVVRQRLVDSL